MSGAARVADALWVRLPALAGRASTLLATVLADGAYLRAWPLAAIAAPAAAFLAGAVLGRIHPEETFTGALWVMGPLVVLAGLSAGLGLWAWLGYVLVDFFVFPHDTFLLEPLLGRAGLIPTYLLLAMLVVVAPLTVQTLVRSSLPRARARVTAGLRTPLAVVLGCVLSAIVVYAWTQTAPILVRPAYTWVGDLPTNDAIQPVQATGWFLVFLAAVMGVVRPILQQVAEGRGGTSRLTVHRLGRRGLWPVGVVVQPALTVLLLAGALEGWLDAVFVWVALAGVLLARQLLAGRLAGYARLAAHVPILLRAAVAVAASYVIGQEILGLAYPAVSSFRPVLFSALVSLVVFTVLLPEWARRRRRAAAAPAGSPAR